MGKREELSPTVDCVSCMCRERGRGVFPLECDCSQARKNGKREKIDVLSLPSSFPHLGILHFFLLLAEKMRQAPVCQSKKREKSRGNLGTKKGSLSLFLSLKMRQNCEG